MKILLCLYLKTYYPTGYYNWFYTKTRKFIARWIKAAARKRKYKRVLYFVWALLDEYPELDRLHFEIPSERLAIVRDPLYLWKTAGPRALITYKENPPIVAELVSVPRSQKNHST